MLYQHTADADRRVIDAVCASRPNHPRDALAALTLEFPEAEIARLESRLGPARGRLLWTDLFMDPRITRRGVLVGVPAALAMVPSAPRAAAENRLAALERRHGGRLGVFAVDTGSGRSLGHRADQRFLMCSTFKMLLVGAVLALVDGGRERLDRRVAYGARDLLEHAPVTRAHVGEGSLSVEALCAAAVELSDNTAADLLLATVGGPRGVTRFVRGIGDPVTRLDRIEPESNREAGVLDTTTPRAMAGCVRAILLGRVLEPASRVLLEGWMHASTPGLKRLRAGLPQDWNACDKSGTGAMQTNDVALARPPGHAPVIVTAYYEAPGLDESSREAVLRDVGSLVGHWAAYI